MKMHLFLTLGTYQWMFHQALHADRPRQWALTAFISTIMSIAGLYTTAVWATGNEESLTNYLTYLLELFRAYLIVDLVYNGFILRAPHAWLDFWIHHTVFPFVITAILDNGYATDMAPWLLMEIPTAFRALGSLNSEWRSDTAFGITLVLFRILWPTVIMAQEGVGYPVWLWCVFVLLQCAHVWWFLRWCAVHAPTLLRVALRMPAAEEAE